VKDHGDADCRRWQPPRARSELGDDHTAGRRRRPTRGLPPASSQRPAREFIRQMELPLDDRWSNGRKNNGYDRCPRDMLDCAELHVGNRGSMDPIATAGEASSDTGPPLRVFLSHTSDLGQPHGRESFVGAAVAAVQCAGHVVTEMAYFPAGDTPPAVYRTDVVTRSDVYVGIIGLRYGEPVRDRPDFSYTELEFEAACDHRKPRLIFLILKSGQPGGQLLADRADREVSSQTPSKFATSINLGRRCRATTTPLISWCYATIRSVLKSGSARMTSSGWLHAIHSAASRRKMEAGAVHQQSASGNPSRSAIQLGSQRQSKACSVAPRIGLRALHKGGIHDVV